MAYKRKAKRRIAVIDFETDPFDHGRFPRPFAWGFYDGTRYVHHWQKNAWLDTGGGLNECANILVNFLLDLPDDYLILAHNGGKFDFLFFIDQLTGSLRIVNGRILQANLGRHVLRDSYGILPIPLAKLGGKLDIDYKLMERDVREDHREEILHYLEVDCIELYKAVTMFYDEFGDGLTIGGVAMKAFKKFHPFDEGNERFDSQFRKYYFGGRCQCFESGVIETPVKVFDLNSAYAESMRNRKHPVTTDHTVGNRITKATIFVEWEGENYNAVPVRTKVGLDFTVERGRFKTTIHEFEMALETKTIKVDRIIETIDFRLIQIFDSFVDHYYGKRLQFAAAGDAFRKEFYKLSLNTPYGKFAQNPEGWKDSILLPHDELPDDDDYQMEMQGLNYRIWSKPTSRKNYLNVATAASITGGTRATLLRGISNATRPLYCDTDSVFCNDMSGLSDAKKLGAWKFEMEGDMIAIAGKKLYAIMGDSERKDPLTGRIIKEYGCIKKASKGTTLSPMAIAMIARGNRCETANDAPSFKLDGKHVFIKRTIGATADIDHSDVEADDGVLVD